jgi:hypothetical protein
MSASLAAFIMATRCRFSGGGSTGESDQQWRQPSKAGRRHLGHWPTTRDIRDWLALEIRGGLVIEFTSKAAQMERSSNQCGNRIATRIACKTNARSNRISFRMRDFARFEKLG